MVLKAARCHRGSSRHRYVGGTRRKCDGGRMDGVRFDTLARSMQPATRRTLLRGVVGGLLAVAPLALGREDTSARRRRNRRRTWNFSAAPLTHLDEHPSTSGDAKAYNSKAQIT